MRSVSYLYDEPTNVEYNIYFIFGLLCYFVCRISKSMYLLVHTCVKNDSQIDIITLIYKNKLININVALGFLGRHQSSITMHFYRLLQFSQTSQLRVVQLWVTESVFGSALKIPGVLNSDTSAVSNRSRHISSKIHCNVFNIFTVFNVSIAIFIRYLCTVIQESF